MAGAHLPSSTYSDSPTEHSSSETSFGRSSSLSTLQAQTLTAQATSTTIAKSSLHHKHHKHSLDLQSFLMHMVKIHSTDEEVATSCASSAYSVYRHLQATQALPYTWISTYTDTNKLKGRPASVITSTVHEVYSDSEDIPQPTSIWKSPCCGDCSYDIWGEAYMQYFPTPAPNLNVSRITATNGYV